ncbi:hypothetical protein [Hwanghaeella sp. LZ110]|uniref:hypothetical protein n=1 Tax=Hwanghaeella sp. LZ110 TaxID=3402810 RepID=UPI003B67F20D
MNICKALIIADPWIGYILDGSKTWEMRSTSASHRGWFGLIRKGSGAIFGVARLVDTGAPLSQEEMIATFEQHRIPKDKILSGEVAMWNTPWKLADIHRLSSPVPYRHRNGAVTWVELDEDVSKSLAVQLEGQVAATIGHREQPAILQPKRTILNFLKEQLSTKQAPINHRISEISAQIGKVEITQGNIDNHHIYLRSFFDLFPDDAVGGSNRHEKAAREVTLDWGGGETVQTDLDGSKRFFRARGWIRAFFELNNAKAGDSVSVEETSPYCYKVRLQKAH